MVYFEKKYASTDYPTVAINELEQIASNLSNDSFPIYLNCYPRNRSSKQWARLLGFISDLHGDELSPFISKMLANIFKSLRDLDTNVQSAYVDSVATMARQITEPPFLVFLRPLMEAIFQELEYQSLALFGSTIEASSDPDVAQLLRFLPKLVKSGKSQVFKTKPVLLSLIGSIVEAGGTSSQNVLAYLVPCLVEFSKQGRLGSKKGFDGGVQEIGCC